MEIEKGEVITLSDNRDYVCLSVIMTEDGKKYLYLMTTLKPIEFCFAEETIISNTVQMRIIGSKDEKRSLFALLKNQRKSNFDQGAHHD